uniref:Uncharacterized protein n=1 Tax=Arundo donax TaxID=35708 RepID=A0A0A9AAX2_ARUDO
MSKFLLNANSIGQRHKVHIRCPKQERHLVYTGGKLKMPHNESVS